MVGHTKKLLKVDWLPILDIIFTYPALVRTTNSNLRLLG